MTDEPVDDPLDDLLGEAFRASAATSSETDLPVDFPAGSDRFQIGAEIGRGGMGVVHAGRDLSLRRPVAVKMLQDQHRSDRARVQRFFEEAQITGQLQHPGIAPVHELGVDAEGRPYFSMKRVEGETLAGLLSQRSDLADQRRRFLGVFEQVCQTVAYAHSRRVIHRDLKPSNIMIGAFGEVQVIDWGLAKVLGETTTVAVDAASSAPVDTVRTVDQDSASLDGSVLGTPRYMAPEQASGAVREIDERADVFSLGAILCVVLTGSVPVPEAKDSPEAVAKAARSSAGALLDPLRETVDEELASIALRSLDPEPSARFCNAGELADAVSSYLEKVEERTRAAQVAAAEERARAVAERRTRRVGWALVAVVLVAGAAAVAVQWSQEKKERTRIEEADQRVLRATDRVTELLGNAAAAPVVDASSWLRVLRAAEEAVALAGESDAQPAVRNRAESLLSDVRKNVARAEETARIAARDEDMVERLDRANMSLAVNWDYERVSAEYSAAFADYGIEIDRLSVQAAVSHIKESAISDALVRGLHDWFECQLEPDPSLARRLFEIAGSYDPDPFRIQVCESVLQGSMLRLLELANSENLEDQNDFSILVLGDALFRRGDAPEAIRLYRLVQRRSPDGFWINFQLGFYLTHVDPIPHAEVLRFTSAALALRRDCAPAWTNLASAQVKLGQAEDAIYSTERALELEPDLVAAYNQKGMALRVLGDLDGAEEVYLDALDLDPDLHVLYANLTNIYFDRGDLDYALDCLRNCWDLEPGNERTRGNLVSVLKRRGVQLSESDPQRARRHFEEALEFDPEDPVARVNVGLMFVAEGENEKALPHLREGHRKGVKRGGWDHPSEAWIQDCEEQLRTDARKCQLDHRFEDAFRLYGMALDGAHSPMLWPCRYDAACSAVRASTTCDNPQGARERRQRALDWLREEKESLREDLSGSTAGEEQILDRIRQALEDVDLEAVRTATFLERLDELERQRWHVFWGEWSDLLRSTGRSRK